MRKNRGCWYVDTFNVHIAISRILYCGKQGMDARSRMMARASRNIKIDSFIVLLLFEP